MLIKQFTHYPNATELGMGNTHECYILVGTVNKPNLKDMFPHDTEINVSSSDDVSKNYKLKAKIGSEFRINQLGDIYRDFKVFPGDKIVFTQIVSGNSNKIFFKVENYNRVYLYVGTKGTEIVNKDRLSPYFNETLKKYTVDINGSFLDLVYDKTEKKRSDSPNKTDFYKSIIGSNNLRKGEYYITIDEDTCFLEKCKKSEVEIFNLTDIVADNSLDVNDIAERFHLYLISNLETKADWYWNTITSNRSEIQFIFEIVKNELGFETNSIFDIINPIDANKIYEKCKEDQRNKDFQNQLCSAILGKYKDFLLQDNSKNDLINSRFLNPPIQQIFYGAPGTGKSHTIDGMTNEKNSIRTTFHPDSDYASFVGAYKPMMDKVPVPEFNDKDKKPINEEKKIVYKYEPQVFLKAYVEAWKRYLNRKEGEDDSYYLVIEEINRGNCAQIFGDIFQLLDRDENNGFSSYAISSDSAIAKYLAEDEACENSKFSELNFSDVTKNCDGVTKIIATADELKSGKKLLLPPNLYIWATMNTSDQSLFPIDSAFKRRWNWVYMPIEQPEIGKDARKWKIKADDHWCYWWEFLQAINQKIEDVVNSEDKQLGYFFTKPTDREFIDANTFVNKVIFYLWNDVFKDEDCDCFVYKKSGDNWDVDDIILNDNTKLTFRKFISSREKVDEKLVHWFINNLLKSEKIEKLDDDKQEVVNPGDIACMRLCSEDLKNDENLNK